MCVYSVIDERVDPCSQVPDIENQTLLADGQVECYDLQCRRLMRGRGTKAGIYKLLITNTPEMDVVIII